MASSMAQRWWIFTKERFHPAAHIPMILLFTYGHLMVTPPTEALSVGHLALLLVTVMLFFFKLRLYDEIKDYEIDVTINPGRPLPRGLLKHENLYRMISVCIIGEMLAFSVFGLNAVLTLGLAILYSLIMYKEFFIKDVIRPHLTTYATIHTVVTVPLSLSIGCALTGRNVWELPTEAVYFALNNWALFNIFEFGRKTFQTEEERDQVESYSKIFGRFGAVALVLLNAAASFWLCFQITQTKAPNFYIFNSVVISILALIGLAYTFISEGKWGKIYRACSSVYIIVFYLGLIIFYQIN